MRKILLLIPALNAGGAERVMVNLANQWIKSSNVTILVFNNGKCFYDLNKKILIKSLNLMPRKRGLRRKLSLPLIEIKRFNKVIKEIKSENYNFVLSFTYTMNLMASISSLLLKNKKIIISERNDPYGYKIWLRWLINRLYRKNHTIICQNKMVQKYFFDKKFTNRIIVLPNPVSFNDIPIERPNITRKEIVTVGRLVHQKNQKLLIDAFHLIKHEFKDYNLLIYGAGPLENYIKEYITHKKLENRVFLMGIYRKVMFEVNKSEIFVLSSDFEGFPNALIEAMGTGMPVISTDFRTGIARKLISNDDNGYIVDVNNILELANAIRKLLNRKSDFNKIGENNKKIALQYSSEVIAEQWLDKVII